MTAQPTRAPSKVNTDDDELMHVVCDCDESRTLCGLDATVIPWSQSGVHDCIVCDDLEQFVCERCGS